MIRWLRNFPIFLRTLVTVIIAVVAVLGIFAYLGTNALEESTSRIQQLELRYASLASASIDSRLEDYFDVLARQGQHVAAGEITGQATGKALSSLVDTGLFGGGVFYLDGTGALIDSQPAFDRTSAQALLVSGVVQRAIQSGRRQTGDFFRDINGQAQVMLLAPAAGPNGNIVGYIGGAVNLDALTIREFMQLLAGQTGDRAMLIDSSGIDVEIGTDGSITLHPASYIDVLQPYLNKRSLGIALLDKAATHTSENRAAVFAPLSNAQWTIVVDRPESEILGLLVSLRWQFVYFGGAILALAIFSTWLDEKLLLGPIYELLKATRRLAAGDLATPLRVIGRDETSELSREFETMRLKMADWSGTLSSAVERQTHRLSTLYAIDRVASKTLALEEVLTVSLDRILDLLHMDAGGIFLDEGGLLKLRVHQGLPPDLVLAMGSVDPAHSAVGAAAREKRVTVSRVDEMAEVPLAESIRHSDFRILASTPLIAKSRALGVVVLFTRSERTFAVDDIDLLETIGQQIGGSVHNAQLFESEQHRREQAERLYDLGSEIIALSTLEDTARAICAKVTQSAHAHSATITLIEPDGSMGLKIGADADRVLPAEPPARPHGITMRVFKEGKNLVVSEPDAEQRLVPAHLVEQGIQSQIGMPLRTAGRVIGVFFVRFIGRHMFSDEEIRGLTIFANTAAMALERVRLIEETKRRLEEVGALFELSSVLRGAMTLSEMLPMLLRQAQQMARADAASISIVDGKEIICRAAEGLAREVINRRVPLGEGLIGGVVADGELRHTPFLPRDPMLVPPPQSMAVVRGVGGALCIPLRTADEVVGALLLVSFSRSQFNENEIRLLTAAADIAGGSIHRAILFEQLEHRVHELGSLYEFGRAVSTSLRLEDVVRLIVETVPPAVHARAVMVFLWNEIEERLVMQRVGGPEDQSKPDLKYRAGEGLIGWVFVEGRATIVPDVLADPRWKREPELEQMLTGGPARNVLAVPIIHGKKGLGVLLAVNREPGGGFSDTDQSLFTALAGQTAIALENAKLFEDVRDISVAAISSLATAIDARDPYTRGHSEDVTRSVVVLARELGWEGADLEMIEFAALLHDVGKIAVPDNILRKPEDLSPEEWDVIYLHPYHSAQIVRPVEPLRKIIPWIYHHHEHWDGSGYPDHLKGEEIPEGARIIAVVDAFNAMTTDRPYHKALPEQDAIGEISRSAGKQFDPRIVKAFLKVMATGKR
jgi:GAF domain-containing protein/HAMP domain-containing protein